MNILKSKKDAWMRFLNQYLVTVGNGYLEYRRILKEEGLDKVVTLWKDFVNTQLELDNITVEQRDSWHEYYPRPLQLIIATRKYRGEPTGKPKGNPNWIKAKQERNA